MFINIYLKISLNKSAQGEKKWYNIALSLKLTDKRKQIILGLSDASLMHAWHWVLLFQCPVQVAVMSEV